jgi:predicted CoA-binding protein
MSKKTVVIGASENPDRYAYRATVSLDRNNHPVVPVGLKEGHIQDIKILSLKDKPAIEDVDTVTLYVGPLHQPSWYDYILSLKPSRVIFNPGTENEKFYKMLEEKNIEHIEACTLVMLSVGNY